MQTGRKKITGWLLCTMLLLGGASLTQAAEVTAEAVTEATGSQQTSSGYTWIETNNMVVSTDQTIADGLPKNPSDGSSYIKWTSEQTGNMDSEPTNPVFLDGRLYRVGGNFLYELDVETGVTLKRVQLAHKSGYTYFLTAGNGMLFMQEGLYVQAFDADLNSLWVTEKMQSGNQGLTPLTLDADTDLLYGGTVGVGSDNGCYFCVDAGNGSIVWQREADPDQKSCGSSGNYTGYYWAGSVVAGDYLIYAGEGGRVYSVEKATGNTVDTFDTCEDASKSVRDSVVYENGYLYFATTDGTLYKLAFDVTSGKIGAAVSQTVGNTNVVTTGFGSSCTATPVIYQNRLYIGDSTCVAVFDVSGENLSCIYRINTGVGTLRDIRLAADAANHCVYGFTQYYKTPGSLLMFRDAPGQTSGQVTDFAPLTACAKQYSAGMPIFGPDGTIYFSNDAGILMAVASSQAYLTGLTANGTFNQSFAPGQLSYELTVAPKTSQAVFEMTVPEGASVTVNGAPVTVSGQKAAATVALSNKTGNATICIVNGTDSRTYTVAVREASTDATLRMDMTKLSQSNIYNASLLGMEALSDHIYISSSVDSKWKRFWVSTMDAKASYQLYAVTSFGSKTSVDASTKEITNPVSNGDKTYFPLHFAAGADTMAYRVHVTAEDGVTTQDYYYMVTEQEKSTFLASTQYLDLLSSFGKSSEITKLTAGYLTKISATIPKKSYTYTGKAIKPAVTVKNTAVTLASGTDYTVSYRNNTKAGTATVTVSGRGKYAGLSKKLTFQITKKKISAVTFSKIADQTYTGKALKPSVTVKDSKTKLKNNTDYTLKYSSNKNVGTAKLVITGKGSYTGSKTISFKINPKKTKVTRVVSGKKKVTVKWSKVSGVTGYKIYSSTKKNGKYKLTATVKSGKTSYTHKKLKSKQTYYYKIVTYKKVSGKTYTSAYSPVKSCKTK